MVTRDSRPEDPLFLRELGASGRRRALLISALRLCAFAGIVLGLYFAIPIGGFNEQNPAAAWLRLAAVGLAFLAVMAVQLRTIMTAHVPQIRAAEAVVESVLLLLCLFAMLYVSVSMTASSAFSEPLDRIDALYFTTSTFTTVGFGDITPDSQLARSLVSVQMLADLGALLLIAKVAFFTAGQSLARQPGGRGSPASAAARPKTGRWRSPGAS